MGAKRSDVLVIEKSSSIPFSFLQAELELGKRTPSPKTLDAKTLLKENRTNGHVNGGYANGHANGVANGHSILNGNINV